MKKHYNIALLAAYSICILAAVWLVIEDYNMFCNWFAILFGGLSFSQIGLKAIDYFKGF